MPSNMLSLVLSIAITGTLVRANDICSQPRAIGPCRGALERYYYNAETESCTKFMYGGCKGNKNNFNTVDECADACGSNDIKDELSPRIAPDADSANDICSQPRSIGPCKAAVERYYYNPETESCTKFLYGGCRGNENNFNNVDECVDKCGANTVKDHLSPRIGSGAERVGSAVVAVVLSGVVMKLLL